MRLIVAVLALVTCVHGALWSLLRDHAGAPSVEGSLASVSYAPFAGSAHPDSGQRATAAQIRADLKVVAPMTRAIRTYSSTGGVELVPPIADEFGLKVTVGAWIDQDNERNTREMRAVVDLARKNRNVNGIVVGNETIFRGEKKVDELINLIHRVKREVNVPVTTGEIWHVWIEHPELASAVDFIAAHVLPYWEGFSENDAVDQAVIIYNKLRDAFPGKRIVIAEFGWPSGGYNLKKANPGRIAQAMVLRDFVSRAEALGIDYNIVESIDQPWKVFEGSVGAYWGLFDASRQPKFSWNGPITNPDYWKTAAVAVLIGFLLSLPILSMTATWPQAVLLASGAHTVGAWGATLFAYWKGSYFVTGAAIALGLGVILLIPLVVIALSRIDDIAAVAFGPRGRKLLNPGLPLDASPPKVSIHIPAYREPPEMLKQTLNALAQLEYPNYECVVVINNTPDPALWRPVEEHCRELGARFKFVRADNLSGFKAGALRLAAAYTAADAEIIGVIDADYVVSPDWLKDLVPAFADPEVGLVQAPQDHRDEDRTVMHYAMNGEYSGFFDVGMVERNERNAIVVHGTMCLIRRSALDAAGGWSSDTICEDTDLGLSILERGWRAEYTRKRYGFGLLPDTYEAFKKQRHRWAYGGVQIVKKHWRQFLPNVSRLNAEQKREFAVGWLNWLGAESVGVAVALLNLLWVPVVAFAGIAVPDSTLTLPILAAFVLSVVHFSVLYRLRVSIPITQTLMAMFAAMSVQWTVARAVADGLIKDHLPFARTAKGGAAHKGHQFQAFWEAIIGGLLVLGALVVIATNRQQVREIYLFAVVLAVQSVPFLSAVLIALLEGSRANDFAFWRNLAARAAALLPQRGALSNASPRTSEKPAEKLPSA